MDVCGYDKTGESLWTVLATGRNRLRLQSAIVGVGDDDDFNLYSYVGNDPLNEVDPTGMCTGSRIENDNGSCKATGEFTNDTAGAAQGAAIRMAQARPPRGGGGVSRPGAGQRAAPPNSSSSERYFPRGSLRENEKFPNAHVLRKHVGRTISQLRDRFRTEPHIRASSSFRTEADAQSFISSALAQRALERIAVGSGTFQRSFRVEMGQPTGTSVLPNGTVQTPTAVIVVLRHDRTSDTGYYIYTAYPD